MKRAIAICWVILGLFALLSPTAVIGGRGFVAHPSPSYILTASGSYVKGPCILRPGASQAHCRPDLGVITTRAVSRVAIVSTEYPTADDPVSSAVLIEPTLPPPRYG